VNTPTQISVLITTYNQGRFIGDTVDSVLSQTEVPFEIVVVDDGSTDDTPNILRRFGDRIRVVRQRNKGVAAARNRSVAESRGNWLALLDGDDRWRPNKLAGCMDAMRVSDASLIVHDVELVNEQGQLLNDSSFRMTADAMAEVSFAEPVECTDALLGLNFIVTCSQVLVRRSTLNQVGPSDENLPVASDYDLWLRILRHGRVLFSPQVLGNWRQVQGSASGRGEGRYLRWSLDRVRVLRKFAEAEENAYRRELALSLAHREMKYLVSAAYNREERVDLKEIRRVLIALGVEFHRFDAWIKAGWLLVPQRVRSGFSSVRGLVVKGQR